MKKFLLSFLILTGILAVSASAAQSMSAQIVSVSPGRITKPGTDVTVTVSFSATGTNQWEKELFYYTAYLSTNPVWGGGNEGVQVKSVTNFTSTQGSNGFSNNTQTFTFKMADIDISNNGKWDGDLGIWNNAYIIIMYSGGLGYVNAGMTNTNNWDKNNIITQQLILEPKIIIYNTALVGDKSSHTGLIVAQPVPTLKVTATPSNGYDAVYTFTTKELNITLDAFFGDIRIPSADIYYTIDGTAPTALSTVCKPGASVTLGKNLFANSDTVRLKAFADESSYESSPPKEWIYVRKLPKLNIEVANYSIDALTQEGVIPFDTKVFGTGTSELGIPERGNIKFKITDEAGNPVNGNYTIYYTLNGGNPTTGSKVYDSNKGVEIESSVTLKAIVVSEDYSTGSNEWTFVQELKGAWLNLLLLPQGKSAYENPQVNKFGQKQAVQIQYDASDGQLLKYRIDDYPYTVEELLNYGIDGGNIVIDTVSNKWDEKDIVYVSAYVYNGDYDPSYKFWKFIQEHLPNVILTPSEKSPKEMKFTGVIEVTASVPGIIPSEYMNFEIWYTIDGTTPSPNNGHKIDNNGKIRIDKNTTIKIAAFSDDRLPSDVEEYKYRLTADAKDAWFYDTEGKGVINKVVINTTIPVNDAPDNVRLVSPWDQGHTNSAGITVYDTIVVEKNGIIRYPDGNTGTCAVDVINKNMIVIVADKWIFSTYSELDTNRETGFEPDPKMLGKLTGAEYSDTGAVWIGDSIAPVPLTATYAPGSIVESVYEQTGKIERYSDTLIVKFSEATNIISGNDEIFEFYTPNGSYAMKLKVVDGYNGGNIVKFEVVEIIGDGPFDGDSLRTRPYTIQDKNNYVTQENTTNYVLLNVKDIPYKLIIKKVSPIVPGESNNPVIVADFLTNIKQQNRSKIDIKGRIMDATGNVVASLDGLNGGKGNISAEIIDQNGTTKIYVKWNGKNRADRNVGVGSYLTILSITGPDGATQNSNHTIGVGTKK
ncbi:MAG: chitobiase/beta-hexosaminidase C-terminal domain-containing protein [Chitinispirillales bacterium]|jgi:hypothetical protein|nr:chitobiase/beta-hexosaminidase C-terminal domain-containing protein [Chitinispirillales bacterium]